MRGSLRPVARMNTSLASAMSAAASNNSGKAIKETMRLRFITDSSLWAKKRSQARLSHRAATPRHYLIVVVLPVAVLVPVIIVVAVTVDMMHINGDAAVGAAADSLAHGRGIAAGADYPDRRRLRDEDEVALGIGRHRVRAGRLRDGLDQDAGPVDHAEHCRLGRSGRTGGRCLAIPVRARVVASIALVEPDFIRADDPVDVGEMLGRGVDHQRA